MTTRGILWLWIMYCCCSVRVVAESSEFMVQSSFDGDDETIVNPPAREPKEETEDNDTNMRCRWGEHCPPESNNNAQHQDNDDNEDNDINLTSNTLPFVPPKKTLLDDDTITQLVPHKPPEGFVISARVYTDPDDGGRAHFDLGTKITLPYWECGAVGSTTHAIQVKDAYFRHSLGTQADIWSGNEYGPHPHLLIPLADLELTLSSGESQMFKSGDVILLEDVLASGHKMRAAQEGESLDALIVTLPQHYHFVGKDRVSLGMSSKDAPPCPNNVFGMMAPKAGFDKPKRQVVFGAIGALASSATALFLTKVAPLWLSVGIGGTCFIVGGTGAAVVCGEAIVEQIQTVMERKRLEESHDEIEVEEDEEGD